jgi:hypothetical protein
MYDLLPIQNCLINLLSFLSIDGETYNFSRLLDALKAYDAHAIARNGRKTALNLPEEHFDVTNNSR